MNRDFPKSVFIIFILIGIIFLSIPIYTKTKYDNFYKSYKKTEAILIESKEKFNKQKVYSLTYKYMDNEYIYFFDKTIYTNHVPKIGSKIKIKYNPSNPNDVYFFSTSNFKAFIIGGLFFIFISLIFMFSNLFWLRDILLLMFSISSMIAFTILGIDIASFIISSIIFGLFSFAAFMELLIGFKDNKIHPIDDIKKEIEQSKRIKEKKKKMKENLSIEEKLLKNKRKKIIIISIIFFLVPIPLVVILDINIFHFSKFVYYFLMIISFIFTLAGFMIGGMTLSDFDFKKK